MLLLAACNGNQPSTVTITPEASRVYPNGAMPHETVDYALPDAAYPNPGDPERQLDASSELVTMSLASRSALSDISRTVAQDPPTRAELSCAPREALCAEAKSIFTGRGIPVAFSGSGDGVTLVYERLVARDCDNRFVDNSSNMQNLGAPSLGCSVRANTVQMVSDRRQIVNPSLMDMPDAQKASKNYERYEKAVPTVAAPGASGLTTIVK